MAKNADEKCNDFAHRFTFKVEGLKHRRNYLYSLPYSEPSQQLQLVRRKVSILISGRVGNHSSHKKERPYSLFVVSFKRSRSIVDS